MPLHGSSQKSLSRKLARLKLKNRNLTELSKRYLSAQTPIFDWNSDSLVRDQLDDPVLHRIVDEADTVQEVAVEPAATRLDLICEGIRLVSPDDAPALDRGAYIYDALYAKLAQELAAQ